MDKKVCVFLWNNFINDARVRREVKALQENGYEVTVIATYDGNEKQLFKEESYEGSKVIRVWNLKTVAMIVRNKRGIYKVIEKIIKVLDKVKIGKIIDVLMVITNMIGYGAKEKFNFYHSNDLKTLPQGVICSKVLRKSRLIYDAHEVETSRAGGMSKIKYIIEKNLINYPDTMIMTTNTRAEYTSKLYNIETPAVVHNYPMHETLNNKEKFNLYNLLGISKEEPILLYQGGLQVGRGLDNIIKATPYFNKGKVVFIGDGPLKKDLVQQVNEKQLQDKVFFVDKVPAAELLSYTQHAYLGFQVLENTCFNHYSALSNKVPEYIMAEVPMVCSDFPEMKRIVEAEQVGVCINSEDISEIIKAVNGLLENQTKYTNYKKNCKRIKDVYTWENEKRRFTELYDRLQ